MSKKHPRVIGTTKEAIARAEGELGRAFPLTFREWLLEHNGKGLDGISIFPILDDRDVRMTWNSIVRQYREDWADWLKNFEDEERIFDHLLPFGDCGTGDFYCFDDLQPTGDGERAIVLWSHETGEMEFRAKNFAEFAELAIEGEFDDD